ncbi:AMP-binding protein [Sneathiella chinensis]|uniref:ATP-dependent acyl-CoA ligase n=1 Tax=Sneathiella chinensis TaxID=349750 RepID=A0ABQ5U445_9PROT|nr:AMP-binding protein [Sneathiella chinensis]GLQ06440.1 ATP-dependent acyl-CoA ligase [Sneathiella chinensis]
MKTLHDAFADTAKRFPDNAFLAVPPLEGRSYYPDGAEFTYAEVVDEVARLQGLYRKAGYAHGHRVGLLLENRPEYVMHLLALNGLGVSCVPINPDYQHDEMLYQMEHSEADLAVCIAARHADLMKVSEDREQPLPVVRVEDLDQGLPTPVRPARTDAPDLMTEATLLYTSGTTGRPKGCILTNEYHLTAGHWYAHIGGLVDIRTGQERLYNPLPLFHMNAAVVSLGCMILTGGCLIIPDRFHPRSWWKEVVATQATIIHYLGVVPPMLLNQPVTPEETAHSVRFGIGAGVEPELHEVFEKRYGFPLIEVWGMTETGRIFVVNTEPRMIHTRAFGRPTGDFEAKIVDENDNELPRGEPGELLVRCRGNDPRRGFFAGYLKNDEATVEAWKGGWFHTGDTVIQDDSGMLFFVDRKKNIIRRSGENIAAAEVEAVLQSHDGVAQVAVIAVKDDLREEEVMACIVPMAGWQPDEALAQALFDYTAERMAYYKPPGWLLFMDQLPTTGTQKIQKTQIFSKDEDPREQPGIFDFRALKKKKKH